MEFTEFTTYEENGKRYRWVYDEFYETRGSYAYDTEEETRKAEDHEITMLEKGKWVVLGCIVSEPCLNKNHCTDCSGWTEIDSCWGIVSEPNEESLREYARHCFV